MHRCDRKMADRGFTDIQESAIFALTMLAQLMGIRCPRKEFLVQNGNAEFGIKHVAERFNIELSPLDITYSQLVDLKPPFIVLLDDGSYGIVLAISSNHVEVRRSEFSAEHVVRRSAFEEKWSGKVYVVGTIPHQLDTKMSWTKGVMRHFTKYRTPILQVAVVSGFVHSLSLCTPIVVLLIIDKVISHNGFDTLDVLVTGLVAVGIFEFILSVVREGILRQIAIQTDVELGSQLYAHVTALPLSWFVTISAGEIAAKFSSIGRIRDFLSLHTIAVALDVVFALGYLV